MTDVRRAQAGDRDALTALQQAAYARNAELLGATPIPLQADYAAILHDMEVWLAEDERGPAGALILQFREGDMLIWSIATHPRARGAGLGRRLLAHAERRARDENRSTIRLYTASVYTSNIDWYARCGFAVESRETRPDRVIVHMIQTLRP